MLATAILLSIASGDDRLPDSLEKMLAADGFVQTFGPPPPGSYVFEHIERPLVLRFSLSPGRVAHPGDLSAHDRNAAGFVRDRRALSCPSGFRLGAGTDGHRWHGGSMVVISGFEAALSLHSSYKIVKTGGRPVNPDRDKHEDATVESLARWTFALMEGAACERTTTSVAGSSYRALRDGRGGLHVPALAFASRTGRASTVNSKAGRISFTSSRGDVLLVLGCPEVKVGGTWHRINGVVMADGDQVLLPLEVLPWID